MYNGKVYKRLCAVFMVMVMIFCGGRCVYAHGNKLEEAKDAADKNPTIENLDRLCKLYEKDVKYYKSRKKHRKAKKAEAKAAWTKARQAGVIARNNDTAESFAEEAKLWDIAAERKRDVEKYKDDEQKAHREEAEAKFYSALAKAQQTNIIANDSPTLDYYKNASQCWEDAAELAKATSETYASIRLAWCRAKAALAKAQQASIIVDTQPTIENYQNEAMCFDDAAKLFKEYEDTSRAKTSLYNMIAPSTLHMEEEFKKAKNDGDKVLAKQLVDKYKAKHCTRPKGYLISEDLALGQECAANYFDELAESKGKAGDVSGEMNAKAMAAYHRMKETRLIANKYSTAKNFENAAQCCEDAAKLKEKGIGGQGYLDLPLRRGKSSFQSLSAWYKAKQASIIADNDNTIENCEDAVKLWNTAATLLQKDNSTKKENCAKLCASWYKVKQASIIARNNNTANGFKIEVDCYYILAEVAKKLELNGFTNSSITLKEAAFAREKMAEQMPKHKRTRENHENELKLSAILAELKEEFRDILEVK